ncbi:V-type ATP synthase subunit I [Tannerella sp.]|uniref:V-type ATP synthase subunit I n=1 Tax=Tannerella sp. TaxID=2382127 RepID=UPI0026DCB3CE|nr:V-type ATPase 116kDa subunit family protein [Tannerella sp.]MDO4703927.1 V-type ATPase 116kDa subunit family protein [Tannerella sp.]
MIVKMSKYAFMVYHKEYDVFLERLREMGVVHIQETRSEKDDEGLQQLLAERKRLQNELRYLTRVQEDRLAKLKDEAKNAKSKVKPELNIAPERPLTMEEGRALLERIETLRNLIEKEQAVEQVLEKDIAAMSVWGEFDYASLDRLRGAGYEVTFFSCPASRYDTAWAEAYNAIPINVAQSAAYFVTITPVGTVLEIDAERVKMPEKGLKTLREELQEQRKKKAELNEEILQIAINDYKTLQAYDRLLSNEYAWDNAKVQTNREADDRLMLLEGWIPTAQEQRLENELDRNGYYFRKLEIQDEDNIPVELKNNRFNRLFEPITKLYSLPNSKEFDSTPFFAPFFMLFFGICFGDGGYGLLLIIFGTLMKFRAKERMKPILSLMQYFGLATLVIGTLSGTFFGVNLGQIDALVSIRKYFLSSENIMTLSIIIGFFHVLYGKFIAALKVKVQRGFKYSLSGFAWVFLILALACVVGLPMMNVQLPKIIVYILYGIAGAGAFIVFFYNSPGKNILLNFGSGLWTTYNTASGLLGDTLSYIRLYAIGLTGSLLGGVFNMMAIDMTSSMSIYIRWLPMLLILLFGHALNIGLSLISSLVHPMRLIYVEYYKNSEFEGGGNAYTPFKKL